MQQICHFQPDWKARYPSDTCSAGYRGFRIKEKVARSDTVILIIWALFREKCCICFFNLFVHFFAKNAQIIYYSAFQKATFVTLHNTLKKRERAGLFTLLSILKCGGLDTKILIIHQWVMLYSVSVEPKVAARWR